MTNTDKSAGAPESGDTAEAARHARFGKLPDRIRPEDTIEETPATSPDPAKDAYDDNDWLIRNVAP